MSAASSEVPAAALAEYVLGLRPEELPTEVVDATADLVLDTVGAGLRGRDSDAGLIMHDHASTLFQAGPAAVWGHETRLHAEGAALVNATQGHALELDDYHSQGKLHPAVVIVPTALAVAPPETTGMELLTSVVAAYEVMVRVSLSASSVGARQRGWHLTGIAGTLGAAAAAGKLQRLDQTELVNALGIAASCSAGLFAFSLEGSMTKPLHAGRAAQSGIEAAQLAAAGFTGPSRALDAEDGGLLRAISDSSDSTRLTDGLGERFAISDSTIKPFPACGSVHSSITAMLYLRNEHDIHPHDIEEVVAGNSELVRLQCGYEYTGNGGALEARMSLCYCVAAAAMDGAVGLNQFTPQRRRDPELIDLARRVRVVVDQNIDRIYPRAFPAELIVRMSDGREFEHYVPAPDGSPDRRLSRARIEEKFRELSANVLTSPAQDRLTHVIRNLSGGTVSEVQQVLQHDATMAHASTMTAVVARRRLGRNRHER